jgi:hypothetical protein
MDQVPEPVQPMMPSPEPAVALPAPTLIAPRELLNRTWELYKLLFARLFPILVVACIGSVLTSVGMLFHNPILTAIMGVLGAIVSLISAIALIRIVSGIQADASDITGNLRKSVALFLPYLWVAVITGITAIGGLVLLVIPGIIISIYLSVSIFVFIIEGKRGFQALTQSFSYISGRWWQVLWRTFVFGFFIVIASALLSIILSFLVGFDMSPVVHARPLGITLIQQFIQDIFFVPISLIYTYILYTSLKDVHTNVAPQVDEEAHKTARTWITVLLVVGIIAIPVFVGARILVSILDVNNQNHVKDMMYKGMPPEMPLH